MPDRGQVRPSVVIVGAGPTGLALALELGSRGIPCLVLERNARSGAVRRSATNAIPNTASGCRNISWKAC